MQIVRIVAGRRFLFIDSVVKSKLVCQEYVEALRVTMPFSRPQSVLELEFFLILIKIIPEIRLNFESFD